MRLSLLVGILATVIVFPETPIARTLHRHLVERVAQGMNRVRLAHIVFGAALTAIGMVFIVVFEGEGLRVFGMMAPEAVSWFAMFDVALFLDVFAMTLALAATTRLKAARDQIIAGIRLVPGHIRSALSSGRRRARRDKSTTVRPKRSDDPDPFGAGYAFG
ncbi:MAG TPA: hypothetical protein VF633_06895 [Brevundimonas sp.]|jgi:hypothetical protein